MTENIRVNLLQLMKKLTGFYFLPSQPVLFQGNFRPSFNAVLGPQATYNFSYVISWEWYHRIYINRESMAENIREDLMQLMKKSTVFYFLLLGPVLFQGNLRPSCNAVLGRQAT